MYKIINNIDFTINNTAIMFLKTNAIIPFDQANTDYQAYLKWLDEGNTPEPAEE